MTAVALLAPLAGLTFSRISLRSPSLPQAWLLGLAVTSLVAFFALDLPGFSQLYFLWFGYCAAAILAAGGLVEAVRRWPSDKRRRGLGFIGLGVAAGVLLGLAPTGTGLPLVKAYMGLAVALAAVAAASAAGLLRGASWPAVVAVVALLTAGLLDAPADRLPDIASRALADDEAVHREADPVRERGLSIPLAEGLRWVRDHTDEDALLAVDNHLRRVASGESRFYYYSALSERRVYLESWDFTDQVLASGVETGFNPFPARLALNDSVYTGKGGRAAAALKRRGVDYVLVDRVNAPPPSNHIPGRVVFRNDALVVYRL